jgi:hypothetical protein
MSLAILDAREWQQTVDLRTGRPLEARGPLADMVADVVGRRPYPGDRDAACNDWVADVALEFVARYDPRFAFLSFSEQYYSLRHSPLTEAEEQARIDGAFAAAERFARESGFTVVLVGTGELVPAAVPVDLEGLDGLAVSSNWCAHYAGLYDASAGDLDKLANHPAVAHVASKADILSLFGGAAADGERLPEHMVAVKEGHYLKGTSLRRLYKIPQPSPVIPVSNNLGPVACLTDIRPALLKLLRTDKVALALIEGVGCCQFPQPYQTCANGRGWFAYEPGDGQFLAISQGKHSIFEHNGGYRYYQDDTDDKAYPYSGFFSEMPTGTIGEAIAARSIAVGNRSMFMHMLTGCDVTCECFARNLYNQGVMAVIHRQDKHAGK